MNILITDDERLVRINLKAMLEELYPGEHHIKEAENGREMVKMIEKDFYDVAFVDINMPKINGLDALEMCRQKSPETQWLVLTGYADFSYAKRSISLGVKGYLLKPPDIEELKLLMDDIVQKKEEMKQNRNQLFENKISQAITLADITGTVKELYPDKETLYSIYLFFIETDETEKRQKQYEVLYENLSEYLKKNIKEQDRYALFFLQTSELCLLIEGQEYIRLASYLKLHSRLFDPRARIAAICARADSFQELYLNKQLLQALANIRMLEENYKTMSLRDLNGQKNLMEKRFLCEKIEMLTAAYMTKNYGLANELLQEMELNEKLAECYESIDNHFLRDYLSIIWKDEFEREGYTELLHVFRDILQKSIHAEGSKKGDVVTQIKEYVTANYMNDVTIAEMGSIFNINPFYISRIFKEKTGEKYIDFVTQVRMKKAMDFLRKESDLSVKEAALRVGYTSEKYFSRTFKKYYDILPSQVAKE